MDSDFTDATKPMTVLAGKLHQFTMTEELLSGLDAKCILNTNLYRRENRSDPLASPTRT